jgi:hypothetical protein
MCVWCAAVGCVGVFGKSTVADLAVGALCTGAALVVSKPRQGRSGSLRWEVPWGAASAARPSRGTLPRRLSQRRTGRS